MRWNAYIAVRCNGKLNDNHWDDVKEWAEVDKVWSSMGDWDFWLQLNDSIKSTDELEGFVFKLRKQAWVDSTCARWWKEL